MTMRMTSLLALFLLAGAVSCGSDQGSASDTVDVQAFRSTAEQIEAEAQRYRQEAQQVNDVGACQDLADAHVQRMDELVGAMAARAGDMDGWMTSHDDAGSADLACTTGAMHEEVQHHAAVACSFGDMTANHDEAARHADLVEEMAEHQQAHADEMLFLMGEPHGNMPGMGSIGVCTEDGGFDPDGGHGFMMPGM